VRVVSREQMYQALFDFWSKPSDPDQKAMIVTSGRRLRTWSEVPANEQPAIFQTQGVERPMGSQVIGLPQAWECRLDLVVYTNCGDDVNIVPTTQMNGVLDYLENLFPISGSPQTLGDIVREVRIAQSGIKTDEGALGSQAVAIVPLRIVTL